MAFCQQGGGVNILFPFLQDTNAADVWGKYGAIKHDITIIGHDGTVRVQYKGAGQIDIRTGPDEATFKNAVIAAMP
jgi:hypothetical protein